MAVGMRVMMVMQSGDGRAQSFRIRIIIVDELIFLIVIASTGASGMTAIPHASIIIITINNHPFSALQFPLTLETIAFLKRIMMSSRRRRC